MRMPRLLVSSLGAVLALSAGLLLSACDPTKGLNETNTALSSDTAQNSFAISCGIFKVLSTGYDAYVAANPDKISEKAQNYIALAKAALVADDGTTNICTPPYPTNVTALASKLSGALINVYAAYNASNMKVPAVTITASGDVTTSAASSDASASSNSTVPATTATQ